MNQESKESTKLKRLNATFVEIAIHLGFVGFLVYWAYLLVRPFIPIGVWAVVLATALYPSYRRLKMLLGGGKPGERWAAALITLAGLLIVLGPSTWLGLGMLEGSKALIQRIESGGINIPPPSAEVKSWPLIGPSLFDFWQLAFTNLSGAVAHILPQLRPAGEVMLEMVSSAGAGTLKFIVSVVLMGFLLIGGPGVVAAVNMLARRIDPAYGERFVALSGATIRAVSSGVIGISLLQAVIGGLGMWLFGVPFASLLTLAILVLGIVQLGPFLVAAPVVVWAWMTLAPPAAIGLTICMSVTYLIEAALKPFVLAHGLTTPTLVIFIGVVGGILEHGVAGLFAGPIVLAVAWEFAKAWALDEDLALDAVAPEELAQDLTLPAPKP
ncbi:AI-2E family transporter [Methylocystis heyeri]|uniref:AI-2E family transporter n=1 Tax=Methylocystis heyeri TaxID=391905 RepID=A0A6B8KFK8_9HYPH|nr:AI-2E family transporter [Methylocystis heyeri]QGM45765.1 AI-2E family transporter [Methylocystis heyeri]